MFFKTSLVEILMIIDHQKRFLATCCGRLLRSSRVYHTNFFDPGEKKKTLETCAILGMSHVSESPTKAKGKFGGLGVGEKPSQKVL